MTFERLNAYHIMWLFVFFDLPVTTKNERHDAMQFRKNLEKDGFSMMQFYFPKYILIVLFCAFGMIFYPVLIFDDKRIQLTGAAIGSVLVIALSAICFMRPPVYSAEILGTTENRKITENCKVFFADPKYGDVSIVYEPNIDEYMVRADFKKAGDTVLTLEMEDGTVRVYDVHIERDTYSVTKRD